MCLVPKENQAKDANGKPIFGTYQGNDGRVYQQGEAARMYRTDRMNKNLRQDLQPAKGTGPATLSRGGVAPASGNSLLGA